MSYLGAGTVIDGRYEIEAVVGEGGMGVVLRARQVFTGQRVALKMLHPHLRLRTDLVARFLTEARAPGAIGHPGIVSVLDAGTTPTGDPYFAMELLDGEPLAALMRRAPMHWETIRRICLELLDALAAAHAAGFVHRDLKPENVFLASPNGSVKILDFGIAKSLGELEPNVRTATGAILGTLDYMSPEQLRNAKKVDARSDLYALGVILFQMVTGELPYQFESMGELVIAMLSAPPRSLGVGLADVPPELDAVVRRALAVEPDARFGSAREMAAALRELPSYALERLPGAGVIPVAPTLGTAPSPTLLTRPQSDDTPRVALALIPVVLGALLLVGLAFLVMVGAGMKAKRDIDERKPVCEAGCKTMIAAGMPSDLVECTTECQADEKLASCMGLAGRDADKLGLCYIKRYCGSMVPVGRASCKETKACQARCPPNEMACSCGCFRGMDPSKAAEAVIETACAWNICGTSCLGETTDIAACQKCTTERCQKEVALCGAN